MNFLKRLALRFVLGKQYDYMVRTLTADPRLPRARMVDIIVRKDAVERRFEADWLKVLTKIVKV